MMGLPTRDLERGASSVQVSAPAASPRGACWNGSVRKVRQSRATCLPRQRLVTVSGSDVTTTGRESRDGTGRRLGGGYRSNPGRGQKEVLEVLAVQWPGRSYVKLYSRRPWVTRRRGPRRSRGPRLGM